MAKRSLRSGKNQARLDELGDDPGQVGPDSAGQSGDSQGLSEVAEAGEASIEDLADNNQAYEAEVIAGVEDAGDHPEKPVHTHENKGKTLDVPPKRRTAY